MDHAQCFTGADPRTICGKHHKAFELIVCEGKAVERPLARVIPLLSPTELGEAYSAHFQRLTSIALRFTRNVTDAEDVVQNGFEKALKNRHQFRGDSQLSTWLHRIVANEALMWLRSQKRRLIDSDETAQYNLADPELHPSAEDELRIKQERQSVREAIEKLDKDEATVLEHCGLGDESYASFGKSQNLHPAAVKTRAFRARRKLQSLLEHTEAAQT